MKQIITIIMVVALTACSFRGFQPPPEGYEVYKERNLGVSNQTIMQDMKNCGFPDVYHTSEYLVSDRNEFTKSTLCMESKGYRSNRHGGICKIDSFKNTEACQKHLRNGSKQ